MVSVGESVCICVEVLVSVKIMVRVMMRVRVRVSQCMILSYDALSRVRMSQEFASSFLMTSTKCELKARIHPWQ